MVKSKSDQLSIQHKDRGNRYYRKNEYFKALVEYNKALLYAQSKENLAFAYANRSACYLEVKKYDECLQNIQWARENNYPAENIQKLNEREEKCHQLKAEQVENPLDDVHDFFKLSHPPNPKIPFIADCLQLGPEMRNGRRGIFTTRDLKPGDIVAIEKGVVVNVHEKYAALRCCKCLKGNMLNLIPCTKSATLMFCSENCRDETYAKINNLDAMVTCEGIAIHPERLLMEVSDAFGGRQKLIKFLKGNWKMLSCTVFDFDFSNPEDPSYKANLIKCLLGVGSLMADSEGLATFDDHLLPLIKKTAEGNKLIEKFLIKFTSICETRTLSMSSDAEFGGEEEVMTVNAFNSHFHHRCMPNAYNVPFEDGWAICVLRPIKAGEELFRNYFYNANGGKVYGEMKMIAEMSNTVCECHECVNNVRDPPLMYTYTDIMSPKLVEASKMTKELADFTPQNIKSFKALIERIKLNWAELNEYYTKIENHPSIHPLSNSNVLNIHLLSCLRFMPCVSDKSFYRKLAD